MIKYYKKEDSLTKYYSKINDETKVSITVYKNLAGPRCGINVFTCTPLLYNDWSVSTMEEFDAKLKIIKELIV